MNDAAAAVLIGAVEGRELSDEERDFIRRVSPSGVTLFGRNILQDDHGQVARLVRDLQALRPAGAPPLVVAIDQEGGRVARLKGSFPNRGPALTLEGGRDDAAALRGLQAYAGELGHQLGALGINVNFAPCVDLLTEPTNTAIGDRAFGTTADLVIRRAGAFLAGLQASGVLGCLKHFPGQGDAKVDTHLGQAVVDLPRATLWERELAPFRALLSQAPMVMIAHCIYPALDDREASRSPRVMGDLLRGELGYQGVVVSDDMTMGAIPQDESAWQQAIVEAVLAGGDMILVCRHLERFRLAYEALQQEARRSPAFARRLTEAAGRVLRLREKLSPA